MQLSPIADGISEDLRRAAAVGGEESSRVAEILVAAVEPALRLHLLDAVQVLAGELSESAPGARVEVRLEGRDPVVSLVGVAEPPRPGREVTEGGAAYGEEELTRLTVRLPEGLKARVEEAAARSGSSINAWIVAALGHQLSAPAIPTPPGRRLPRRITGYVQG